jgi:uridine phosphorylase
MNSDNVKKWKTVRALITFRQAIRDASVQGYVVTEDYLYENISKVDYDTFLRVARKYDKMHHGSVTF